MLALVLDLDGVIRHFDPADVGDVERRHGLEAGSLLRTAFEPELLVPATTGELSRPEWAAAVGDRLGAPQAAAEWESLGATVDWEVIEIVRLLRAAGTPVAVLTNGTSGIAEELQQLGIADEFDTVFNSYDIGFAKPDHRVFHHVLDRLRVPPHEMCYLDDTLGHVTSALELRIDARHYSGIATLKDAIAS